MIPDDQKNITTLTKNVFIIYHRFVANVKSKTVLCCQFTDLKALVVVESLLERKLYHTRRVMINYIGVM